MPKYPSRYNLLEISHLLCGLDLDEKPPLSEQAENVAVVFYNMLIPDTYGLTVYFRYRGHNLSNNSSEGCEFIFDAFFYDSGEENYDPNQGYSYRDITESSMTTEKILKEMYVYRQDWFKFLEYETNATRAETSQILSKLPDKLEFPAHLKAKIRFDDSKSLLTFIGIMS
ncbi:MAG: hypothetical protein HQK85_11570, partial [Nitrospinae bacterium]|nr:hypothetical protein [Nitrospinota bacterium]